MLATRLALLLALPSLASSAPQQTRSATPDLPRPSTCFDGTGGPGGDFDWVVHAGEFFVFDTTSTVLVGGPGGLPTSTQTSVGGLLDVRDLTIEEGGVVRVQGPTPLHVRATGRVLLRGRLDLSGFNARAVATLNTGNQIEPGAAGVAAGGRGGNANGVTTASTPRGQTGFGPYGVADQGGEGGESAFAAQLLGKNARRPGGGGGGRFARDQGDSSDGLAAGAGGDGSPQGTGAVSGAGPARGGAAGVGPFVDPKPSNDYFGVRPVLGPHGALALVRGELAGLMAGYGGGGGGNAVPSDQFPHPAWTIATDEKGGGGGGGAGGLYLQALGPIVFGALGEIRANGGLGASGENTNFLDHVGGTGGSGSGGHVVLETAAFVDFTDGGANTQAPARAWVAALGRPRNAGPSGFVDPCCTQLSNGGASGPGVIQIHVPDPFSPPGTDPSRSDIVVPASVATLRHPLTGVTSPPAIAFFPLCGISGLRTDLGGSRERVLPRAAQRVRDVLGAGFELDAQALTLPRRP